MKYILNKEFAYYIINKKVVVSSFYKDELIDCELSAEIISTLNSISLTLESIASLIKFPLPVVLKKFNTLKFAKIIVPYNQATPSGVNTDDLPLVNQGYFSELVSSEIYGSNVFTCSNGKKLLYFNNSKAKCQCAINRLLSHRPLLAYLKKEKSFTFIPPEPIKINSPNSLNLEDGFVEFDLINDSISTHKVIHYSSCPYSKPYQTSHLNFKIRKVSQSPYRTKTQSETIAFLKPLISKYMGVISQLEYYGEKKSENIHNYVAGKNSAFSLENLSWVKAGLRSANGGKGTNKLQAQCSALCEAIERYSMLHHERPIDDFNSANKLNHRFISSTDVLNYSQSQFAQANLQDKKNIAPQHWIPNEFSLSKSYYWLKAFSITQQEPVFIPAEIGYAQLSLVRDNDRIAMPDSNGCAAGGTLLEAAFQGTLELIERDAIAIWWYNRIPRNKLNLKSFSSSYIQKISEDFNKLGRTIDIVDISSDINVPVYVAISYDLTSRSQILYGFGCHVKGSIAAERAVSEVCQLLPTINNPQTKRSEPKFYEWLFTQAIDEHSFLNPECLNSIDFLDEIIEENLEKHFMEIVEKLKAVEQELIVFDLTVADVQLPVVKVISPGLRHFWRRTGPGRLYDVPVKMGFLKTPLSETELNPFDMTI